MKPVGDITRGTTNPNRLRRVDRWILHAVCPTIRACTDPLVVDLGYGASPVTTFEMFGRLTKHVRPDVEVVGIEIDPQRVADAKYLETAQLRFEYGGFEVPLANNRKPIAIRAFNVLRQYDEDQVVPAWHQLTSRLAPDGFLIEGTCDEIGRLSTWVSVRAGSILPESLTISMHLDSLVAPSDIAPRLPKVLIHHNISGQPIYEVLAQLDKFWRANVGLGTFSSRQRWVATVEAAVAAGIPILDNKNRWRLGEITLPWALVAPR